MAQRSWIVEQGLADGWLEIEYQEDGWTGYHFAPTPSSHHQPYYWRPPTGDNWLEMIRENGRNLEDLVARVDQLRRAVDELHRRMEPEEA